jgi:hypothetical protein
VKIEKKLIAISILALLIGVSSVIPMLFLMSGTAKAETGPETWFSLDIPYAYLTANYTENLDGRDFHDLWHAIVLNFTLNSEAENSISDAQFEYYEAQIYTDKEPMWNESYFVGTNRTNSFNFEANMFHFVRNDWFDSNTTSGGMFRYQWNANGSDISEISGYNSGNSVTGHAKPPPTVTALIEAETLCIDVRRIGLVTFNGNSTLVTLSDKEVIQHIELTKYGDGFLHNNMFTEEQLSQIDPRDPLQSCPLIPADQQKP